MRAPHRLAVTILALALPAAVRAQALQCALPDSIASPHAEGPSQREPRRLLPIGGYTLALIWAPEACHNRSDNIDSAFACGRGNRFGFTLHGLWPDGEGRDWPQYCGAAPILSEPLIRRHLCATPSAQLLQHEYAKHGTCMGVPPAAYFARSTGLYARLRYPDMRALAGRRDLTARQFATAFARANPGLSADTIRLNVNRRGWLEEVWLCLDTRFASRACPVTQGAAVPNRHIRVQAPPGRR
jgi:ribonuclease T2